MAGAETDTDIAHDNRLPTFGIVFEKLAYADQCVNSLCKMAVRVETPSFARTDLTYP